MTEYKKDLLSGICFFLFAIALYWGSYSIIATSSDAMGPQFFPRVVSLLIGILAFMQITKSIMKIKKKNLEDAGVGMRFMNKKATATLVILFLYAFTIQEVGFVLTTMVYLFCQILLLLTDKELRDKKYLIIAVIISVIAPVTIYYLFYHGFHIFLPVGILG